MVSHLRGPLGSGCTGGGYRVPCRDGDQSGKEGKGAWQGP